MGFKAEEAVPALEWDFRPYVDAHGTTPEPSNDAINRYVTKWRQHMEAASKTLQAQLDQQEERDKKLTEEELQAQREKWAGLSWEDGVAILEQEDGDQTERALELVRRIAAEVERLSSGCPTAAQVMELPGRVRAKYLGWLLGQLTNPEASAAGTSSSPSLVPGGVGGI